MVKAGVCKTPIRRFDSARRLQHENSAQEARPRSEGSYADVHHPHHTPGGPSPVGRLLCAFIIDFPKPGWRKGRRGGLKIRYLNGCVGSTPSPGTRTSGSRSVKATSTLSLHKTGLRIFQPHVYKPREHQPGRLHMSPLAVRHQHPAQGRPAGTWQGIALCNPHQRDWELLSPPLIPLVRV